MDSIIFAGCSFTYGEGLWRETGDTHQNSINQKYLVENRWLTKVANYFNVNAITKQHNGGNHIWSSQYVLQEIDASTWNNTNPKLVIFQTTQFARHEMSINEQIEVLEEMVIQSENKNIPVRFIHWIWPDINQYEMDFIKVNNEDSLSSKIIRNRTIYILDDFNFQQMVDHTKAYKEGTLANKYTLAGKFKCGDFHMNQEGHNLLAKEIINYIEKNKLL
jgi:hypothetical protein